VTEQEQRVREIAQELVHIGVVTERDDSTAADILWCGKEYPRLIEELVSLMRCPVCELDELFLRHMMET
jgi:hypothetical protein